MKCISILLIHLSFFLSFSQYNYFISKDGNNYNHGCIDYPWRTIQYGINQLTPGDTLNITEGIYEEKIDLNVSGTPNNIITIQSYNNDEVILDAINSQNNSPILYTDNSYLAIKGLHLTNNQQNYSSGILVEGASKNLEFTNNKISNINFSSDINASVDENKNSSPFLIHGNQHLDSIQHIVIRSNEIFSNRTGYSENITLSGNISGFLIENNSIRNNTNIGIDIAGNYMVSTNPLYDNARNGVIRNNHVYNCVSEYATSAGIYIDGGKNIIVENNISHNNGFGAEIGCEQNGETLNIIFRNNLFYYNKSGGIQIGAYNNTISANVSNIDISNNTFYHNDTNNESTGELMLSKNEDVWIENNIFYLSNQSVYLYGYRTQTNLILNYNLVYTQNGIENIETTINEDETYVGLTSFYSSTGYGNNSTYGDPLFISAPTDFHIASNSPAIDSGNHLLTERLSNFDFDNEIRINNIVDCGTDEYYPTLNNNKLQKLNITVYPNPTKGKISFINQPKNTNYEVYTALGKFVKKGTITNNYIELALYDNGIYLIKIKHNSANRNICFRIKKI